MEQARPPMSQRINRGLTYLGALAIALWILIPIYLIALAAFSPRQLVYSWPKPLLPTSISIETMRFFLTSYGVLASVRNSVVVALYDTVLSVALVHTAMALPTTVLVTSSVFIGIPKELEEAAMTLGCNRLQAVLRVVLPLALPGLAAAAIFTFVLSWNEVFAAAILTLVQPVGSEAQVKIHGCRPPS